LAAVYKGQSQYSRTPSVFFCKKEASTRCGSLLLWQINQRSRLQLIRVDPKCFLSNRVSLFVAVSEQDLPRSLSPFLFIEKTGRNSGAVSLRGLKREERRTLSSWDETWSNTQPTERKDEAALVSVLVQSASGSGRKPSYSRRTIPFSVSLFGWMKLFGKLGVPGRPFQSTLLPLVEPPCISLGLAC